MTIARAVACLGIIVAGLVLRRFGLDLGIPAAIVKYGGSILWGAMVFFLVAIALAAPSRLRIAAASIVIAVDVELLRLLHAPWLDEFRLTIAGGLLLGRIFSLWNILAYGVGILLALLLDCLMKPISGQNAPAPHSPS